MDEAAEEIPGSSGRLFGLIELIYSAAEDASRWPIVLDQIAETVRGVETILFTGFTDPGTPDVSCVARMDPVALIPYSEHYARLNVLSARCDHMFPDGTARYSHRAVPDSEFEKTEFYNEYFKPNNMYYSFGLKIPLVSQPPAYLACMRPKRQGHFQDREGTIVEMLMPHLQRALRLHHRLTKLSANELGLEAALNAFEHAVFGLNRMGKVIFANRQAEKLANRGNGIKLVNGHLTALIVEENSRFQRYLSDAVAVGLGCGVFHGGSLLLSRMADQPLQLTITPFLSKTLASDRQLSALVFVRDPSAARMSRAATLRSVYGLSPTEGRAADLLVAGCETGEVAARLHLTLETTRFHIKRILNKTGTHRQSELMRLMLSLPGRDNQREGDENDRKVA